MNINIEDFISPDPSHRETPSNDRMKTKLKELKKTLNSADVREEIFKRINKT